jgi:4-diphosphocytidyl-2C-methyl-D-erythritol kinase
MVPSIKEYVTIFQSAGGKEILTAGSGPTLFTIVSTRERGTAISLILKHKYKLNSFLVTSVNKSI